MAVSTRMSSAPRGLKVEIAMKNPSGVKGGYNGKTDLSVYMTVDTSGSMRGAKLSQVISSIREILEKAPGHARFTIRSFSSQTKMLVTKKKRYLDFDRVFEDLSAPGGSTVLYDAWSQTLKEIPYDAYKTNRIYVLVFTDGEDNASKAKLPQVIEETGEILKKPDVFFTFVQAGKESRAVQALRGNFSMNKRCKILEVEDSAQGIQFAFQKVKRQMEELRFQIELSATDPDSLAKNLTALKITTERVGSSHGSASPGGGNGKTSKPVKTGWTAGPRGMGNHNQVEPLRYNSGRSSGSEHTHAFRAPPAAPSLVGPWQATPSHGIHTNGLVTRPTNSAYEDLANRLGWSARNFRSSSPSPYGTGQDRRGSNERPPCVRVSNIPFHVNPLDIATIFSRFGRCSVKDGGFEMSSQWVALQFDDNSALRAACRERIDLHGNILKISGGSVNVYDPLK